MNERSVHTGDVDDTVDDVLGGLDMPVDFRPAWLPLPEHVYTPVLTTKPAEKTALNSVSRFDRAVVAPMIVLRPAPTSGRVIGKDPAGRSVKAPPPTYDEHLREDVERLREIGEDRMDMFGTFQRLFVEVAELQRCFPVQTVLHDVMAALGADCAWFTPVTDTNRSVRHQATVKAWQSAHDTGVGIRLRSQREWPTLADLDELLEHIACPPESADLFLDVGSLWRTGIAALVKPLCDAVSTYRARRWRRLAIIGAAFPPSIKDFPVGRTAVVRSELALWIAVNDGLAACGHAAVHFGDHASVHEKITAGGGAAQIDPYVRYADAEAWFVYKRTDRREMPRLCAEIIADFPELPVRDNYGDRWILIQSRGGEGPGQPQDWVLAGLSHHVWFVVRQLNGFA